MTFRRAKRREFEIVGSRDVTDAKSDRVKGSQMATKNSKVSEPNATNREDTTDAPLIDSKGGALKKLLQRGRERGFVTYDELNAAVPSEQVSSEQIEDTLARLSELGINVVEDEDSDEEYSDEEIDESGSDDL